MEEPADAEFRDDQPEESGKPDESPFRQDLRPAPCFHIEGATL
jgi:hypothetical protein